VPRFRSRQQPGTFSSEGRPVRVRKTRQIEKPESGFDLIEAERR
jgi:hypothetical protein